MLEVYSQNVTVDVDSAVPLNNVTLKKGCSTDLAGAATVALNKCGIYRVVVTASSAAATTIQLYKNGVAQAQAQATGTNPTIDTFVQVEENNGCRPCQGFTGIQIMNTGAAAATFTNFNVTVERKDF